MTPVRDLRWIAGIAFLVGLVTGCEPRERTNPFDPGNPDTGCAPALWHALAASGSIDGGVVNAEWRRA